MRYPWRVLRAFAVSSTRSDTAEAVLEVGERLRRRDEAFDAALVFASAHHASAPLALSEGLRDILGGKPFLGWTGASAFHGLRIPEGTPGLVVLGLSGVDAYVRAARQDTLGSHLAAALCADAPVGRLRLIAAPAESLDAAGLLGALSEQDAPLAGALSVSGPDAIGCALAPDVEEAPSAALMSLSGVLPVTAVAQGARPLGAARAVTRAKGNAVFELGGRPALEALVADLPDSLKRDLPALGGRLLAGLGTEDGDSWRMRHVTGIDPAAGALAIAGEVEEGGPLVFALRDGEAARTDLEERLTSLKEVIADRPPVAVLVFSCAGRNEVSLGTGLYDVGRVDDHLGRGEVPVVGVSGGGEIATLGGGAELFAYTAVVVALLPEER